MPHDLLVIIPTYNEGRTIASVVRGLAETLPACDILVLDGYSTDDTGARALGAGAMVMEVAKSLGIGGAVEAGILFASRNGYDYLARIDGDGQHRPQDLIPLIEALRRDEADFIIGSRFLGESDYKPNLLRNTSISLISSLIRLLYGIRVTDCTSGCQLYNRKLITFFARDNQFEHSEVRAIWTAGKAGFRISERFINMAEREAGQSSFTSLAGLRYMFTNLVDICMSIPVSVRGKAKKS
jgi:glycosyltransferase involved in cell wall biosynthesis